MYINSAGTIKRLINKGLKHWIFKSDIFNYSPKSRSMKIFCWNETLSLISTQLNFRWTSKVSLNIKTYCCDVKVEDILEELGNTDQDGVQTPISRKVSNNGSPYRDWGDDLHPWDWWRLEREGESVKYLELFLFLKYTQEKDRFIASSFTLEILANYNKLFQKSFLKN